MRTVNVVALLLASALVVVTTAVFLLLAYVDASLTEGHWRWARDGWTLGVAALAGLALAGTAVAFRKSRYRLAWAFVLAPWAVAAVFQSGLL